MKVICRRHVPHQITDRYLSSRKWFHSRGARTASFYPFQNRSCRHAVPPLCRATGLFQKQGRFSRRIMKRMS